MTVPEVQGGVFGDLPVIVGQTRQRGMTYEGLPQDFFLAHKTGAA